MAQIIPGLPGFGASFGAGLGQGLEALAQHKIGEIIDRQAKQREAKVFEGVGFSPQESRFLASQPAELRHRYLAALSQGRQAPQQQAVSPQLQQRLGLQDVMSSIQPQEPQAEESFAQMNPSQRFLSALTSQGKLNNPYQYEPSAGMSNQIQQAAVERGAAAQPNIAPAQPSQPTGAQRLLNAFAPAPSKEDRVQRSREHKASLDEAHKINNAYRSSRESEMRLDRMQKLVDSGKLNNPAFASLVKGIHIPFVGNIGLPQALLNTESQEFEKLSTDFVKGAKDIFGSRMTQGEVEIFLKTIPTLTNTDEGKKALIRNLKIMNEGVKIKKQAMDKIRKDNGGSYPSNLEDRIEEVAGPKLESLKDRFVQGAEKAAAKANSFEGLPDPSSVAGKKFRDKKTGRIVQSVDGQYVEVS